MFFRPEFCLELPLASTSRWRALLLTNGWRSLPPFGTFTLEFYTMPGTQKKTYQSGKSFLILIFLII